LGRIVIEILVDPLCCGLGWQTQLTGS
jgi:hypothetical protein